MPPREVLVTYTLYPSGNGDLRNAVDGLAEQFPLRNLHWKSATRTSLRTMQEVDIRLVDLGDAPPQKENVAGSVLEGPLVNICFVSCDDNDLYKNNTKSFIKDWLALLQSRRGANTPLIVLVNAPTNSSAANSKNVFGRDKGILAKLKADFSIGKRDICAQVNLPPSGVSDPTVWPDLLNKLKESVVAAFDTAMQEREEEVKRGEAQRVNPGWNFCTWFLLKESLAFSFEGVNLYEDALIIYEELDAAFLQVQKEQNLTWFGQLGGTGPQDDSLPILDTTAKPYHTSLMASNISVFDFRIYVFARQCALLGKLGRVTEIAKRGQWFVASLARRLRESEADLPEFFIESWTFTASRDLVVHCDEWSRLERPNNDYSGLTAYESARSELLDIARIQVERIGVGSGLLPDEYPFQSSQRIAPVHDEGTASETQSINEDAEDAPQRPKISNPVLIEALKNSETFLSLYEDLTRQALDAYRACAKVNSLIRLKACMAALAVYGKKPDIAYDLFRALAKDCADLHVWDRVAIFALEGALWAHSEQQMPFDEDWTNLVLGYLRACSMSTQEPQAVILEAAVAGLREHSAAQRVATGTPFSIRLIDRAASSSKEDVSSTSLVIEVNNALPIDVAVKGISLRFTSDVVDQLEFASASVTLRPGSQRLVLHCYTSVGGSVTLAEAVVTLGAVDFVAPFPKGEVVVPIRRSLLGLRTSVRMPTIIALDETPQVVLEVCSGAQLAKGTRLALSSLLDEVGFHMDRAICEQQGVEFSAESIFIGDIAANSVVVVSVPYSGVPRNELAKAQVVVQYESSKGNICTYIDEQGVYMGLPITVNVQDYFRPNTLVSGFSIASDGREYVNIGSVTLQSSSPSFTVTPCRGEWTEPEIVTPSQPLSCLFRIQPCDTVKPGDALALEVRYQTIEEHVQRVSEQALASSSNSVALARSVRTIVADRARWLQQYVLSKDISTIFDESWRSEVAASPSAIDSFITALKPAAPQWRTLRIPVEIPLRRLLTTVRLASTTPAGGVYEGRALSFDLELSTSLAWFGGDRQTFRVSYDIQASAEDWVVVGRKRGVYTADPSQPEKQHIVLVPVRHGTLPLPTVAIQLAQAAGPQHVICETYVANAAQGINVLPARTGMAALVPIHASRDE